MLELRRKADPCRSAREREERREERFRTREDGGGTHDRQADLLKGASAMLARYMDESRKIPTATSFRTFTVTTLDQRRKQLKDGRPRVSFTHLIALRDRARGDRADAGDGHHFAEIDGKPHVFDDGGVNLGIAVDVEKKGGGRTLMVPSSRTPAGSPSRSSSTRSAT